MKKILASLFLGAVALGFATAALAATDEAKATYKAAKDSAAATYKAARTQCDTLKGNPKDVCIAEAKAAEKRSKAEAEAQYKNTPKEQMKARVVAADADYDVAKVKCKAESGNAKDVCMKEAKAVHTKAVVDAKSSEKIGEVKSEAKEDKSDADYKVAIEKCDSLAGPAKDACVASAKSKYGK
ncbi:MAG: hypothetical protein Q8Q81_08570 [Oxalobacteraceae bacterium]|nr:hypothetical protein [Oxalobacteraceae bacterium]